MSLTSPMQTAMRQVMTAMKSIDAEPGTRCFLLKRDGQTKRFTMVGDELEDGVFIEFDDKKVRDGGFFRYATRETDFADVWAQASHVGYGVPVTVGMDSEVEVFEFVAGQKDSVLPSAFSPFWSGALVKEPIERYTIET